MRRTLILLVVIAFFVAPTGVVIGTTTAAHPAPDVSKMSALLHRLRPSLLTLADAAPNAPQPLRGLPPSSMKPGMPGDCGTTHDAGNDAANATPLALPVACNGTLGGSDRLDIYSVQLGAGMLLTATLAAITANVSFELCLASPEWLVLTCSANGTSQPSRSDLVTNESGDWLVAAYAFDRTMGAYRLTADASAAPPELGDCGGADAANDASNAHLVAWPFSCEGHSRLLDDIADWYHLDAASGDALVVTATSERLAQACLFLADDAQHPISCALLQPAAAPAPIYADTPGHGGYLLLVFSPSVSSYHFEVAVAPTQNDCGSGRDAPGNTYLAAPLGGPTACDGALDAADAVDVYSVHVPAGVAMGATAQFDRNVTAMLCVLPTLVDRTSPQSCEITWAGGSGIARAGAPAGSERDVLVATVAIAATSYHFAMETHAPAPQNDCGTGGDAVGVVRDGTTVSMPIDCNGTIVTADGDVWDIYRVNVTEGPVYADLAPGAGLDADLCIVDATFTNGVCSSNGGSDPEHIAIGWAAGPAFVAVIHYRGNGSYHLHIEQQNDCGTGADALAQPAAIIVPTGRSWRCNALLDPWASDDQDAYALAPPLVPTIARIHIEAERGARVQMCSPDAIEMRCQGVTFAKLTVVRTPLHPIRITVTSFGVESVPYTLVVEDNIPV